MNYYKQVFVGFNKERPIIEVSEVVESHELQPLVYAAKYAIDRMSAQEIQSVKRVGVEYSTYEFPRLYVAILYQDDKGTHKAAKDCGCISHISPYPAYQMAHSARNLTQGIIDDLTGQGGLGWVLFEKALAETEYRVG